MFKFEQRGTSRGVVAIRMTNAQLHADRAVKEKNQAAEPKAEFKLKRFQNVNPRTSTKRGEVGYMVQVKQAGTSAPVSENKE